MDLQQIADVIMMRVVYGGREGHVITSEDRDDAEYAQCLDAAQAILDGMAAGSAGKPTSSSSPGSSS